MTYYEHITTDEKVQAYEASRDTFQGLFIEMKELSKKKADATLSNNKVKILNRVLDDLREVLKDEPEFKYLDPLNDEDLPQNSDAVLVMVQYESALDAFRKRYYNYHKGWITDSTIKEFEDDEEF